MPNPAEEKSADQTSRRSIFRGHLPLETETAWFILANAGDVFMTYILLSISRQFVEGNPIARYFLYSWGPKGLIYFKFCVVAFVVVVAQVIARRKIVVARRLLNFGTLFVGGVVAYSCWLYARHMYGG